ncbi:MAG: hypothetical protein ACRD8U_21995, partial [Pyrinomonadaceae bacterium]
SKAAALKTILEPAPRDYQSIVTLIERVDRISAEDFHARLLEAIKNKMRKQPEVAAKYFSALFYCGKKAPGNDLTLFLELADASSFEYPVKHEKVRDWINTRLLGGKVKAKGTLDHDVFGNTCESATEKFDDVRTKSALGVVKLRSMARDAGCQHRYGTAGPESCLVGKESRRRMKGSLEWLMDPARKGKTWDSVIRAADCKEVLLAYTSEHPPDPPNLAMMFGGEAPGGDETARFEDCAENVVGALRTLMARRSDLEIQVFVLRKMDAARTRVTSSGRYGAKHLISSAQAWRLGCQNLPTIRIKDFDKDGKAQWRSPQLPFPMEVISTLNTTWSLVGQKPKAASLEIVNGSYLMPSRVKSLSSDDGVGLLLREEPLLLPVLDRAINAATRNAAIPLTALGQEQHARGRVFSGPKTYQRHLLVLPAILGLLLFRLNIRKERYMTTAPYLVGRLLSLADQLHYHYSVNVRNKANTPREKLSVPPQLLGNALMATALEEPVKALALYAQRILPYQAWARTTSGEEAGLARYFLSELGNVCSAVSLPEMPERCNDADKAQMLIGYLARPEKSDVLEKGAQA